MTVSQMLEVVLPSALHQRGLVLEITNQNPDMLAASCLEELMTLVEADIAMWFSQGQLRGQHVVRRMHVASNDVLPVDLVAKQGQPGFSGSAFDDHIDLRAQRRGEWSLESPARRHTNRFATFADDYMPKNVGELQKEGESISVQQLFYAPCEIGDQLRMLVYQGAHALGWFGLYRRGGSARFSVTEKALLDQHAERFVSQLSAIEALTSRGEPDDVERMILERDGSLGFASPRAKSWCDQFRLKQLRELALGGMDSGIVDGVNVRIIPMRLVGCGLQWLITLEPITKLRIHALYPLPKRVRELALLLARGYSLTACTHLLTRTRASIARDVHRLHEHFNTSSVFELVIAIARAGI